MQRIEEEDSIPSDSSQLSDYGRMTLQADPTFELTPSPSQPLVHIPCEEYRDEVEDAVDTVEARKSLVKDEPSRSSEGRKPPTVEMFPMLVRGFDTFKSEGVKRSDSTESIGKEGLNLKARLRNEDSLRSSDDEIDDICPITAGQMGPGVLETIVSASGELGPEEMLTMALEEKVTESRRRSISEKLGFSGKKRENELMERALEELKALQAHYLNLCGDM